MTERPESKAAGLRAWALAALHRHADEGTVPTSIRHLLYEAIMEGVVPKSRPPSATSGAKGRRADQDLTDAITQLRESGAVPWDWLEDRTRNLIDHRGWSSIAEAAQSSAQTATLDPWGDVLPVLVVESESTAGTLSRIADRWRVPVVPTRGHANGWLRTTVADTLDDRPVVVLYVGDWDKAGDDIETNTRRVLEDVLDVRSWERVALSAEQVATYNLPTLDRRDKRSGLTHQAVETEALPQRLLDQFIEDALDALPHADLDVALDRERAERSEVGRLLDVKKDRQAQ